MPSLASETFGNGTGVSVGVGAGVGKGDVDCASDVGDVVAVDGAVGVGRLVDAGVATIVTGTAVSDARVDETDGVAVGVLPAHAASARAAMKLKPVSLRIQSSLPCSRSAR